MMQKWRKIRRGARRTKGRVITKETGILAKEFHLRTGFYPPH